MLAHLDPETARRMREDGSCTWCERFPRVATAEGWKCAGCAEVVGGCTCNARDHEAEDRAYLERPTDIDEIDFDR